MELNIIVKMSIWRIHCHKLKNFREKGGAFPGADKLCRLFCVRCNLLSWCQTIHSVVNRSNDIHFHCWSLIVNKLVLYFVLSWMYWSILINILTANSQINMHVVSSGPISPCWDDLSALFYTYFFFGPRKSLCKCCMRWIMLSNSPIIVDDLSISRAPGRF